jgi:diguanylate cyclase (GGDEF)-like protein/PAS domain S-box-containing protein
MDMMEDDLQQRLHLALATARMAIWDSSIIGGNVIDGMVSWSAEGAALIGLEPRPLLQSFRDFLGFVHPDDRDGILETMQQRVDECAGYEIEYRIVRGGDTLRWVSARAHTICDPAGVPVRTLGIIWDVTERKRQEQQLFAQKELAELTLGSIGDGLITTDCNGKVRFLNRIAEQLTGWSNRMAQEVDVGKVMRLVDEASGAESENVVHKCLRLRQSVGVSSRTQLITLDGRRVAVEDSAAPIWSRDGQVLGAVAVFHDVSHERQLAHQVSWQAAHDSLTGLINRREFESSITDALASARQDGHRHALLFMDLDRFKIVNDTCGHGAGDLLLQLLAKMLQTQLRESDILARLGGDELGVLLACCPLPQAIERANQIRCAIKDFRFVWDSHAFELGVSIGLVEIDENSKSMTELLIAADQACYLAKEQGRNRVHIYRESDLMLARRHGEMLWVTRLNEAFALDRFRLFAQPIVGLHPGAADHQEVLVRIANGKSGLILPGAFIPAAERYGLMTALDRWVIEHVCRHMRAERKQGARIAAAGQPAPASPALYSINLSGTSLNDDSMLEHITTQFAEHQIDPSHIGFEITETAIISNLPKAQLFMEKLRALGCRFALDDFGSGLSSFAYLRSLPVDYLKIDGVFIRDIVTNDINRAMVKAINEVGHVMGIQTVAEYVENEATLNMVRELGIDYAQGYAVGQLRPLSMG